MARFFAIFKTFSVSSSELFGVHFTALTVTLQNFLDYNPLI